MSDADLEAAVRAELAGWWGESEVATWRHLRSYRIPFAQPDQVWCGSLCMLPRVWGAGGAGGRRAA